MPQSLSDAGGMSRSICKQQHYRSLVDNSWSILMHVLFHFPHHGQGLASRAKPSEVQLRLQDYRIHIDSLQSFGGIAVSVAPSQQFQDPAVE